MTIEIISRSISMKVWEQAGIKLETPGSTVRLTKAIIPFAKNCFRVSDRQSQLTNLYIYLSGNNVLRYDFIQ